MRNSGAIVVTLAAVAALTPPAESSPLLVAASTDVRYERVISDAAAAKDLLNSCCSAELPRQFGITFDQPERVEYCHSANSSDCGGRVHEFARNAFYCAERGNECVAFDLDWFVEYFDRFHGDAITLEILAHEWGHAIQDSWVEPGVDRWREPLKELYADCLAGTFMDDALRRGLLTEYPGAGESIAQKLFEGGSGTWFDPGGHGSSEQGVAAFTEGVRLSATYCRMRF